MRILRVENSTAPHGVEIRGLLGKTEFKHLRGHLDNLCLFATATLTEEASFIKTGMRHKYAKYLLLPVKLRRRYNAEEYDFHNLRCGAIHYRDKLYILYEVSRKNLLLAPDKEANHEEENNNQRDGEKEGSGAGDRQNQRIK